MPRSSRTAALVLLVTCATAGRAVASPQEYAFHHENVMGTSLELRVRADVAAMAREAEARVLREIDRLSAILSRHDASSEFRRWQSAAKGPIRVSPELFEVLAACDRWRDASGGAFDPRVQVLAQLWADGARRGQAPSVEALTAAKLLLGRPAWRLEPEARTAERLVDTPLSLDAIAKGYIVEKACDAAGGLERGVRGLLLNVGGDLRVQGELIATIGLARPRGDSEATEPFTVVRVHDRAVATSGGYQRGLSVGGRWYSHIFDPRTGRPADRVACATVIAERSADADALATILNVLPPEDGARLVRGVAGAACLIVAADGRITRGEGWPRYERASGPPPAFAFVAMPPARQGDASAPGSWGEAFELAVDFEINRPGAPGERYRRPYVAIWIEDNDGRPVRNLLLWVSLGGAGPERWLLDLKRWYRQDQGRKETDDLDLVHTTARATRPPGKYTTLWDGKDNHGKPLPRGSYTLNIEAAREHGTYQIIRKAVTIASEPFVEELTGNVEIKAASLRYRRKAAGGK